MDYCTEQHVNLIIGCLTSHRMSRSGDEMGREIQAVTETVFLTDASQASQLPTFHRLLQASLSRAYFDLLDREFF